MKIFKIISLSVLGIIDLYSLYATIGYLILGINTPKIIGEPSASFMGMYIMSITFFVVFLLSSVMIILLIKFGRKRKA